MPASLLLGKADDNKLSGAWFFRTSTPFFSLCLLLVHSKRRLE